MADPLNTGCAGRAPLRRCPADEPGTIVVCVYVGDDQAPFGQGAFRDGNPLLR